MCVLTVVKVAGNSRDNDDPLFQRMLRFSLSRLSSALFPSSIKLGPKKKPGAKSDSSSSGAAESFAPGADHVFNIFAGAEDPKLLPDDQYPDWLWELEKPQKTYGQLEATFVYGRDIENATLHDYRRFQRHHRKLLIKLNNKRLQKRINNQEVKYVN